MSDHMLELESKYHKIAELYDMADDLVVTVEDESIKFPDMQLDLVESLVEQVGESTDVLCEEFIRVAGKGDKSRLRANSIEGALRKIYTAIDTYHNMVRRTSNKVGAGLKNIADPVVENIRRHVEVVIAMMVDFIDLSLDRIMQRQHLEEIRRRQDRVEQMLIATERNSAMELRA